MKKINFSTLFLLTLFINTASAQFSFSNRNDLLSNPDFHSGVAIGVADMNGDGLDDIVRLGQGRDLSIEYQVAGNQMFNTYNFGNVSNESQWSMCVADVDNNGLNDVLAGGSYDNIKLVVANADGTSHTMSNLPSSAMFLQGSNFADINNDGFVDVFACHDDAESRIWGNDGTGNFVPQDGWINMATTPISDNSGNYGSIWTDFDNDGDIDLYIAKCRQGVTNTSDPRRINALFVNDGAGNYSEMAGEYGLKIGWQSWTADFQDIDNDGDLDCFVTNHDYASQLLINDGTGHFVDYTDSSGINIQGLPIQGVMRDFDNDGFIDILVAGTSSQIFFNNGDSTFTEVTDVFDNNNMESYALGDLNNDGFVDIYGGYANIYTSPSTIDDVVWMNDGNANNHLAVQLQGVVSNRNAIGSRIEIYGDWGIQVREVRAGESYGIMNSMTQYFGLGTATTVDSVVVKWTSGTVQTEYNVDINSKLTLIEGCTAAVVATITPDGTTTFCDGENVVLSAPAGFSEYQWSNGETTPSITVTTQGNFSLTVTDGNGCFGVSEVVGTIVNPMLFPQIETNGPTVFCEGESVTLTEIGAPNAANYEWSNGATGSTLEVTTSGTFEVMVTGLCQNFTSSSIEVEVVPAADIPVAVGDTLFEPGIAILTATGDDLAWFDVEMGGTPVGFGAEFTTPEITVTTLYYVEDKAVTPGFQGVTGAPEHSGNSLYSSDLNSNNTLDFDVWETFTLDSVKVYTDFEGARMMVLYDASGTPLDSAIIEVPLGESMVSVGMTISPGENYHFSTDANFNETSLGIGGPRLQRTRFGLSYPYEIEDVVSIKNSNFGQDYYYYFYDWHISTADYVCPSERVEVIALLDPTLSVVDFGKTGAVKVAPNPSTGFVNLEINFDPQHLLQIRLTDLTGKAVLQKNATLDKNVELDLNHLAKGVYILQVMDGENVYSGKVVLQ